MLNIVLSNDDGVHAPGLRALADILKPFGNVTVVAPNRDRSGASHSLTLSRPLRVITTEEGFMSLDGTPTDCVHFAITGGIESFPDMVISGINEGSNLGDDILYSGTVAAAMEGRSLGYPAIAISAALPSSGAIDFDCSAKVAERLVHHLQKHPLPPDAILNVNVPAIPYSAIKGFKVTRLGHRHMAEAIIRETDPRGRPIYWVGGAGAEADSGEDTDFYAVAHGFVSITPLQVDLTRHTVIPKIQEWINVDNGK